MIRYFAIIILTVFVYYTIKFIGRVFLNSMTKKTSQPPDYSAAKPKHNLDKSKAIDAQFEELK